METKIRVLIADPDESIRQQISEQFSAEQDMTAVGFASDGEEALRKITELNPDVVLLELVQPRLDGLGVLRKLPETQHSPAVIVLTGFVTGRVAAESAELGAAYFLPKPCNMAELTGRIRQFCRPRKTSRSSLDRSPAPPMW